MWASRFCKGVRGPHSKYLTPQWEKWSIVSDGIHVVHNQRIQRKYLTNGIAQAPVELMSPL